MIWYLIVALLILGPLTALLPRLLTAWYARTRSFTVENAPPSPVAIIFGAGLRRDGTPTPVLRDRVVTGVDLYFQGKVQKLLMSGDSSTVAHDEPGAMRDYAISLGVPSQDILVDSVGRRTYDTCYRAMHKFEENEAILVTQEFHLPRALYICNKLGLPAIGVKADQHVYNLAPHFLWSLREIPATLVAFWQIYISRPLPSLGNPEPIYPSEAQ
jgi:SanA protein